MRNVEIISENFYKVGICTSGNCAENGTQNFITNPSIYIFCVYRHMHWNIWKKKKLLDHLYSGWPCPAIFAIPCSTFEIVIARHRTEFQEVSFSISGAQLKIKLSCIHNLVLVDMKAYRRIGSEWSSSFSGLLPLEEKLSRRNVRQFQHVPPSQPNVFWKKNIMLFRVVGLLSP